MSPSPVDSDLPVSSAPRVLNNQASSSGPLTDADIDRYNSRNGAASSPGILTDADIDRHDSQTSASGKPLTLGGQASDALSHTLGAFTGAFHLLAHPIDTFSGMLRDSADEIDKGKQAWNANQQEQAIDHFKNALPLAGPFIRQLDDEWTKGQYGAMTGDALGAWLLGKTGGKIPELADSAPAAAQAIQAAAKAGGADLAGGAGKIAGGLASMKVGALMGAPEGLAVGFGAGAPLLRTGAMQIGHGASAAIDALKAALGRPSEPVSPAMQRLLEAEPLPSATPLMTTLPKSPLAPPAGPVDMPEPRASNVPGAESGQAASPIPPSGNSPILPQHTSPLFKTQLQFETEARGQKAVSMAQALNGAGISARELGELSPDILQTHLQNLTKAMGINKSGAFSTGSIQQTLFELRKIEQAQTVSPEMMERLRQTNALGIAQQLRDALK